MYEDMRQNGEYFDMSEYDPSNPLFGRHLDNRNKKVLGKFKDEHANGVITHVVAPRPKMYGIRSLALTKNSNNEFEMEEDGYWKMNAVESKKAKGISKVATKNQIALSDYVEVLETSKQTYAIMKGIRSTHHVLYTEQNNKKALNGMDSKRYSVDCVNSFAFGHKNTHMYE